MKRFLSTFFLILFFLFCQENNLWSINNNPKKKVYEVVKITTDYGIILIWLYDQTPLHKENFIKLTKEGYFNGTTFHRVIKNFVIQGGDPNSKDTDTLNDGQGGPDYTIQHEIKPDVLKHIYGAVGAAREGDNINPDKRSSGSQFYIVINKKGTPHLDGGYTVFGIVISGMEVAEKIADQPKNKVNNRPFRDIKMTVEIVNLNAKQLLKKYKFAVPIT